MGVRFSQVRHWVQARSGSFGRLGAGSACPDCKGQCANRPSLGSGLDGQRRHSAVSQCMYTIQYRLALRQRRRPYILRRPRQTVDIDISEVRRGRPVPSFKTIGEGFHRGENGDQLRHLSLSATRLTMIWVEACRSLGHSASGPCLR